MKMYHQFHIGDLLRAAPVVVQPREARTFAERFDKLAAFPLPGSPQAKLQLGQMVSPMLVQALALGEIFADMHAAGAAVAGGPAIISLRFHADVYVHDRLQIEAGIVSKRLRDGVGRVRQNVRVYNQTRQPVMTCALVWPIRAREEVRPEQLRVAAY